MTLGHKGLAMATAAWMLCVSNGNTASAWAGAECVQFHGALYAHIQQLPPEHLHSSLLSVFLSSPSPPLSYFDMKKCYRPEVHLVVALSSLSY